MVNSKKMLTGVENSFEVHMDMQIVTVSRLKQSVREPLQTSLQAVHDSASSTPDGSLRPGEIRLQPSGSYERTQWTLPNGGPQIILLHKKGPLHLPNSYNRFKSIDELVNASDAYGNKGFFFNEEANRWCKNGCKNNPHSNCHAFIMQEAGITENDWLLGVEHTTTDNTNPLFTLLNTYWRKIAEFTVDDVDKISRDQSLQENDILMLTAPGPGRPATHIYHEGVEMLQAAIPGSTARGSIHSALIKKINAENRVACKMGEGPVVVVPLSTIEREYEGLFDRIEIHRRKQ